MERPARLYADTYPRSRRTQSSCSSARTSIPFRLLSSGLSPSRISQRYPAVRAAPRKGAFRHPAYVHTRTRTQRTRSPLRAISSGFHPSRIDITRSATSTLKPLSTFSLSRPPGETLESETLIDNSERVMLPRYIICFYTTRYA
ncbi:hypothetical protein PUN28_012399 [Cardiocondyla obscurior]|uniref:Uncharacterized protein n=1 Tax=Cardiocondyla obscurior TaxID=286306 RepID=A0AAW2FDA4_9HYME